MMRSFGFKVVFSVSFLVVCSDSMVTFAVVS